MGDHSPGDNRQGAQEQAYEEARGVLDDDEIFAVVWVGITINAWCARRRAAPGMRGPGHVEGW